MSDLGIGTVEYTVIGKFFVPQARLHRPLYIMVRDYSLDASRIEFWAESPQDDGDIKRYFMEIDSPSHGNTVMHSLIAGGAAGTITEDWLSEYGWSPEEAVQDKLTPWQESCKEMYEGGYS